MSDNEAIKKLLYVILKQKCLKDIDWNKVAEDPILSTGGKQDITNGHAARMRYSRFKKSMEGPSVNPRRSRGPSTVVTSPKKPRVKKDPTSPSKRLKTDSRKANASEKIKLESHRAHGNEETGTCTAGTNRDDRQEATDIYLAHASDARVKPEPGLRNNLRSTSVLMIPTPNPSTPRYSPSPSPSQSGTHSFQASMSNMDLMTSFDIPYSQPTYLRSNGFDHGFRERNTFEPASADIRGGVQGYGALLGGMDMHDDFGAWDHGAGQSSASGSGDGIGNVFKGEDLDMEEGRGVPVKTEPRWGDAYRQV